MTSVLSKVVEKLILQRCASVLHSTDNQFGFKPCSSTDLCISTLKQVVHFYTVSVMVVQFTCVTSIWMLPLTGCSMSCYFLSLLTVVCLI